MAFAAALTGAGLSLTSAASHDATRVSLSAGGSLQGTRWQVRRIDGRTLPSGYRADLAFRQHTVSGHVWCNDYRGRYRVSPELRLRFRDLGVTLEGCGGVDNPPDFLGALLRTRGYRRGRRGLVLLDRNGSTLVQLVRRR